MTRLLLTATAIVIVGAAISGAALAQYQAYQPNPYQEPFPTATPLPRYTEPQYGGGSYQYPAGPGGQWQQSYQRGARPDMSGSTTVPPDVATSTGTTMPNPAYMPSAAQLGTDGGTFVPYGYSGR